MSVLKPVSMSIAEQADFIDALALHCRNGAGKVVAETLVVLRPEDCAKLECCAGFLKRLEPHVREIARLPGVRQ